MKKWEYKTLGIENENIFKKVLHKELDKKLNELGEEGWELVNTFQENENVEGVSVPGYYVTFVFKRLKEE